MRADRAVTAYRAAVDAAVRRELGIGRDAEKGPLLAIVVCARCKRRETLANVVVQREGLLFVAELPADTSSTIEVVRERTEERVPQVVDYQGMLLDWPDLDAVDGRKPIVYCRNQGHGQRGLTVEVLVGRAAYARRQHRLVVIPT